jgi:hypothetical protein
LCVVVIAAAAATAQAPIRLGSAVNALSDSPAAVRTVHARVGPDEAPFETVAPNTSGAYIVQMPAGKRLLLNLGGAVDTGYQVVGEDLRALPVGSTLDAAAGLFAWEPPVPFLGSFQLLFLSGGAHIDVVAAITDPTASSTPLIQIDTPTAGSVAFVPMVVAGWALDPLATTGAGIDTLHVWAYRRDLDVPPQFLGAATVGGERSDVARAYGQQYDRAGFTLTTPFLKPGTYDLVVYAWSHRTARFEDQRTVRVIVN